MAPTVAWSWSNLSGHLPCTPSAEIIDQCLHWGPLIQWSQRCAQCEDERAPPQCPPLHARAPLFWIFSWRKHLGRWSLSKLLPSRPWQFSAQFDSVIENTGQPATWHRPAIRKEIYEEKGEAFDLGLLKMDTLRSATYYCLDEKHANNTWLANLNSGRSHFLHFCPIESFLFNQMIPIMLSIEPRAPSSNFWVVQSLVSTFVSGVFAY